LYADGPANFERVRVLKLRFPRVALVAYVSITTERARDMFDAGRCGLDGLIVADLDDAPATMLMHVEKAEARSVASVLRPVIANLKPTVRDAVLAAVTRAHERLTPEAFARLRAVPRRLLTRRLTEAGFPAPHRLLTWGRLIVAAHMLEDVHRSADSVAQVLDFPSGSAFRNTCQRYLHVTPQQMRERGGATYVIGVFMKEAGAPDVVIARPPAAHAETDSSTSTNGHSSQPRTDGRPSRLTPAQVAAIRPHDTEPNGSKG
jgi:AraC-like DNA-binding protein